VMTLTFPSTLNLLPMMEGLKTGNTDHLSLRTASSWKLAVTYMLAGPVGHPLVMT